MNMYFVKLKFRKGFLLPFRTAATKGSAAALSVRDVVEIFGNIQNILEVHDELFLELHALLKHPRYPFIEINDLGKIFLKIVRPTSFLLMLFNLKIMLHVWVYSYISN